MKKQPNNVIISEGNRPLWQLIIAAFLYTAIFMFLFIFFSGSKLTTDLGVIRNNLSFIEVAIIMLPIALGFSIVRDWHFDIEKRKYKIAYCLGPIQFGNWRTLPKIDYVSVFKQPLADGGYRYEVNLWHNRNKHFNILNGINKEAILEMGKRVAISLNVKLYDATIPNKNKWLQL